MGTGKTCQVNGTFHLSREKFTLNTLIINVLHDVLYDGC